MNSPRHAKVLNDEHQGNYFYDGNQVMAGLGGAHVITHTSGQAYTPTAHGLAYGHSMKYGNNLTSSYIPDWTQQQQDQGLLYEHLTIDQYSQHHRQAGTVYLKSPRHGINTRHTGCICLHVAALPSNVDVALLHDLFAPYGRVVSAQVFTDESGAKLIFLHFICALHAHMIHPYVLCDTLYDIIQEVYVLEEHKYTLRASKLHTWLYKHLMELYSSKDPGL